MNDSLLKDIEQRQDILLKKIEYLYDGISQYQKIKNKVSKPIQEELVLHLSAKQASKNILNFIEQFPDKLSIQTYLLLTIICSDIEHLPFMFYFHMNINHEKSILNLLSQPLTNNS